ncbi:Uncharacterized membrane protein [Raineyella antarctica]|uniref:Uncharacterized membrane protein n=1 Tax=Raineyella antarctica TaxID=1577474 RepID=A0A1G6HFR4_9ACTN|nr:DUF1345 domain-containing protein [Raineyella antarctica]SDB93089.1 Uncharacterized membrane protein [Raineyella antarctica]
MSTRPVHRRVLFRLAVSALVGIAAGVVVQALWRAEAAGVAGWIVTAAVYCLWTWAIIGRLDGAATRAHATEEDPGRGYGDVILLFAALASLVGVGVLLAAGSQTGPSSIVETGLGLLCVASSWFLVHVVFTIRYAQLYYENGGGVDFNQSEDPDFRDFAYLSFTLGMTYQVSDTDITDRTIRHTVLRHTLLSYLLGAVVLASTVNLVASIASNSGH